MFYYNFFFLVLTFQIIFYKTTDLDLFLDDLPTFDHNTLWIMFSFVQSLYNYDPALSMVQKPKLIIILKSFMIILKRKELMFISSIGLKNIV
jgi:hypothetical protein